MTWSGDPSEVSPEPEQSYEAKVAAWREKFANANPYNIRELAPELVFIPYRDNFQDNMAGTPGQPSPYTLRFYGQAMCAYCLAERCDMYGHEHPGGNNEIPAITMIGGTAMCKGCARHDAGI